MEKGMGLSFLRAIYVLTSIVLFVYGFNAFVLIFQYLKHRRERVICPPLGCFPVITVQLPLYNERYVAKRAIDTLVRLDWPRDRLQIQVVDDSTDETRFIVRQCVEKYRHQGVDITHLHRPRRVGFKAGALNEAMQHARGDFVAIFDADFCPPPDLLRRMVPHLVADSSLGFVQVRWGHLNDAFSLVTMAQAIALDGHFAIEHVARERAGWLTNFSGTGGMWRRACIEECGGWDNEILTEDMDLSFRAQLAGWKGLTLCDVSVPGELPVQVAAFEQQQFRWAKGNTHCLLKHRKNIWHAPLPLFARIQAFIHLGNYLAQPLMLIAMLITLPLLAHGLLGGGPLALLSLATLGPPSLYILGQWSLYADWPRRLAAVPVLICLGTGMALNSTVAVVEAMLGVKSVFQRTPKFHIEGRSGRWQDCSYVLSSGRLIWGQVVLTLYALLTVYVALEKGNPQSVPFLLLYVVGFGFTSITGLVQGYRRAKRTTASRQGDLSFLETGTKSGD
jgi:cellulose synthase/poly-beta-1,6-N-acetylglucosamine synthase-like glycosyltransferase